MPVDPSFVGMTCRNEKLEERRGTPYKIDNSVPRRSSLPRRKTVIPTKEGSVGFGDLVIG
jgi:hypothetical protein